MAAAKNTLAYQSKKNSFGQIYNFFPLNLNFQICQKKEARASAVQIDLTEPLDTKWDKAREEGEVS